MAESVGMRRVVAAACERCFSICTDSLFPFSRRRLWSAVSSACVLCGSLFSSVCCVYVCTSSALVFVEVIGRCECAWRCVLENLNITHAPGTFIGVECIGVAVICWSVCLVPFVTLLILRDE